MKEEILEFLSKRPKVIAAYGYGSGVFKQVGYTNKDKPQLDLMLIVNDLKEWHLDNMRLNPKDYSFFGKMYFKLVKNDKLIGKTGVTYLSNIMYKNNIYKYGVIDKTFFLEALHSWNSFYIPGRFHKNVLEVISTNEIRKAILENRENAMIVSLLMSDKKIELTDLLVKLCNMSYAGDTRMAVAENPHKVINIVKGSKKEFINIYASIIEKYAKMKDEMITIIPEKLEEEVDNIPYSLKEYLVNNNVDISNNKVIEKYVLEYLSKINKKESTYQTIKGLKTNGLVRSVKYAYQKVKKRFRK